MVLGVLSVLSIGAGSTLSKKLPSAGSISVPSLEQIDLLRILGHATIILAALGVLILAVHVACHLNRRGRLTKKITNTIEVSTPKVFERCRHVLTSSLKRVLQVKTDHTSAQNLQEQKRKFCREEQAHLHRIQLRNEFRLNASNIKLTDAFTEVWPSIAPPDDLRPPPEGAPGAQPTIWDHIDRTRSHPGMGIFISGSLGSGKTTLLLHVMLEYLRRINDGKDINQRLFRQHLPVYIKLKHLHLPDNADHRSLPSVLAQAAIKTLDPTAFHSETELAEMLRHELSCSACILLLDGLDEISNPEERKRIGTWLARQFNCSLWRGNLFILSAIAGAVDMNWFPDIKHLHIQPLPPSSVRDLIQKLQLHRQKDSQPQAAFPASLQERASQVTDEFFATVWNNIDLAPLSRTPLRLMHACLLHAERPEDKSIDHHFYRETHLTSLTRWKSKGAPDKKIEDLCVTPEITIHRSIIGAVAHHLHSQPLPPGAAEGHWPSLDTPQLLAIATPFLDELEIAPGQRETYLRDLAWQTDLIKHTVDARLWYLPGKTFQEFICADHWVHAPSSLPPDWHPLVADPIWQGPLRHYLKLAKAPSELIDIVQLHGGDLGAKLLADHNNQNVLILQQPPGPAPLPVHAPPAPSPSAPGTPPPNLTHPM